MNRLVPRLLLTGTLLVGFSGAFGVGHSLIGGSPVQASMALSASSGTCQSLTALSAADATSTAIAVKATATANAKLTSTAVASATKAAGPNATAKVQRTVAAIVALTVDPSAQKTAKALATSIFTGTATAAVKTSTAIAAQAKAVLTPVAQQTATTLANWKGLTTYAAAAAKVTAAAQKTADAAALIESGSDTKAKTTLHAKQTAVAAVVTPETVKVPPVTAYGFTACAVIFTVSVNGTPVLPVTWQENTGSIWKNVASDGITYGIATDINNTLTITPTDTMNGYKYRAIAANNGGGAVSNAAVLRLVPYVSDLGTTTGPANGGTSVTINGTSLLVNSSTTISPTVLFGNIAVPSTDITAASNTALTVKAPASSLGGPVNVTVNTLGGTSPISATAPVSYTYGPVVDFVSPVGGPIGATLPITITGTGFVSGDTVTVGGGSPVATGFVSTTVLTATAPITATAGTADVVVINGSVSSPTSAAKLIYVAAPTVGGVTPSVQAMTGATQTVSITGTNFVSGATVNFGTKAATKVVVAADGKSLTASSPATFGKAADASKTVDVTVATPLGGTSAKDITKDGFEFVGAPTVTSISPSTNAYSVTTTVLITGTDFIAPTTGTAKVISVKCGTVAAQNVKVISGTTTIQADCQAMKTKPTSPIIVDVLVTGMGGTSAAATADQFTWKPS